MSRLLENSQNIRTFLESRNLYTSNDPYRLDNRQAVNTINALASIIKPFSSFDLTNTVIYRLIGPNTPIAQIGLQMLGKQFAATVASNASSSYLPAIKFDNLFDGDPSTKFIMRKRDFQITRREGQTNLGRILDSITGVYDYRTHGNPFAKDSTWNKRIKGNSNADYIENSGKGQVQLLVENINRNIYKLEDSGTINALADKDIQVSLGDAFLKSKEYYPSQDSRFYPFSQYILLNVASANADHSESESSYLNSINKIGVVEYGGSQKFVDDLGNSFIRNNNSNNEYNFISENFGNNDTGNGQLVWGRDGVTDEYTQSLGSLKEKDETKTKRSSKINRTTGRVETTETDEITTNPRFDRTDRFSSLNIKSGILNYTKDLLNAKGRYGSFDLTRKKFKDTNDQLHFNGSPLDTHPDGTEDFSRSHSIVDPYDRYVKAIRFDGNKIYNGNPDSVIYNSVVPKFHPTRDNGILNNRNLMFSMENLALEVIKDEEFGVGYINDEVSTSVPLCEVGGNGGRLMWFPPYDIRLSESAIARWDNTEFIGRGEPIYTYSNSERIANMSFKMLMDYPEQIANYAKDGDYHKTISEFFAFGGESSPQYDTNLSQKVALLSTKEKEKLEIDKTKRYIEPNSPTLSESFFYFPNDYPKSATNDPLSDSYDSSTDIESIIGLGYEDGIKTEGEINDYGYNTAFIDDLAHPSILLPSLFNPDNDALYNEDGVPYIYIVIGAGTTSLYNESTGISEKAYNKALSRRRQLATKDYLDDLFLFTFGKSAQELKVKIIVSDGFAIGSVGSDNDTVATISTKSAISERYSLISFKRDEGMITREVNTTVEDIKNKKILNEEIVSLRKDIETTKRRMAEFSPCVFESHRKEDGIQKGFSSLLTDKFYSVFHSQTPEDFHRRLTFLQQCTRQGPAIRVSNNGITSSKNSVFGRQPICVLRFGDFFHTKVIIENISFAYDETTWDLNPEGRGIQPMMVDVTMQLKIIGGQSLRTPIDALQNAASFNYYANSTFTKDGTYSTPATVEEAQIARNSGLNGVTPELLEELRARRSAKDINENNIKTTPESAS